MYTLLVINICRLPNERVQLWLILLWSKRRNHLTNLYPLPLFSRESFYVFCAKKSMLFVVWRKRSNLGRKNRKKLENITGAFRSSHSGKQIIDRKYNRKFLYECTSTHYRPQTKLRKGNLFTSVCQEFCPQGEGEVYIPSGRHPPADPPQGRPLQRTVRILLECILV